MLCQINISVDDFNFTHHAYIFKISWEEHEWNVIFVVRKLLKWWQPLQKKNEAVNLNPDSSFGLCAFLFLRFHSVFLVVRCRCWIVTLRTYMVLSLLSLLLFTFFPVYLCIESYFSFPGIWMEVMYCSSVGSMKTCRTNTRSCSTNTILDV